MHTYRIYSYNISNTYVTYTVCMSHMCLKYYMNMFYMCASIHSVYVTYVHSVYVTYVFVWNIICDIILIFQTHVYVTLLYTVYVTYNISNTCVCHMCMLHMWHPQCIIMAKQTIVVTYTYQSCFLECTHIEYIHIIFHNIYIQNIMHMHYLTANTGNI